MKTALNYEHLWATVSPLLSTNGLTKHMFAVLESRQTPPTPEEKWRIIRRCICTGLVEMRQNADAAALAKAQRAARDYTRMADEYAWLLRQLKHAEKTASTSGHESSSAI